MGKTILIVEDDLDIRELLQEFLESNGYGVRVAENGREALEQLADPAFCPGLILCDRNMAEMDGDKFLDRLFADGARGPRAPVVMMSAACDAHEKRAVAFLRKPFSFSNLLELVAAHCR